MIKGEKRKNSLLVATQFLYTVGVLYRERIFGKVSDDFVLSFINQILPLSIVFDKLYIPPHTFKGLSQPFLNDLEICLGASLLPENELYEAENKSNAISDEELFSVFIEHSPLLYSMSGPFTADFDDTIPTIRSVSTILSISDKYKIPVSIDPLHVSLYQHIAKDKTVLEEDAKSDILKLFFTANNIPIISLNTFRGRDNKVDLDLLFATMESLRKSPYLLGFKQQIDNVFDNSGNPEVTISEKINSDFRELFYYCFNSFGGEKGELALGFLSDLVGLVVPGTSTLKTAVDIKKKRALKGRLSWHLFMWELLDKTRKIGNNG